MSKERDVPYVSIIIPIYNAEKYLRPCLDSLLRQTMQGIEIICVDDGSTDQTAGILEEYRKKDLRITVLKQQQQGAAAARNYGMQKASGEYLLFLDADDIFEEALCEKSYIKGKSEQADIVLFGAKRLDMQTEKTEPMEWVLCHALLPERVPFSYKDVEKGKIFQITSGCPWSKLFRREFVLENGLQFQNLKNANDVLFVRTALALAKRITYVDASLVLYRYNQGTSIQSGKHNYPLEFYKAYVGLKQSLEKHNIYKEVEQSYLNLALNDSFINLDSYRGDWELYQRIKDYLLEKGFADYGIPECNPEMFYQTGVYHRYRTMARLADEYKNRVKIYRREDMGAIKVSVIIPIYNVEDYIEECLCSVLKQTLTEIEILCVNDGTKDNSMEIVQKYADDERIVILNKENGGLSSARNYGLQRAKGEYVYFLDSDDYIADETLETLYKTAKEERLDNIFFDAASFFESDKLEKQHWNYKTYYDRVHDYSEVVTGIELMDRMSENDEYRPSACLQMPRREFLLEHHLQFYEGILHEDNLFTFQNMICAGRVRHLSRTFYQRRVREASIITKKVDHHRLYGFYVCFREASNFLAQLKMEEPSSGMIQVLKRLFSDVMHHYNNMEEEERKLFFAMLPLEEQARLKVYIQREFDLYVMYQEIQAKKVEEEIQKVKSTTTFKAGRLIMWIPSAIMRIGKR
ncbi:MAG: glycosyltransferase [Bacteroidales bacterium]|nr:glycosyltransferase [Clostridium sp.]MCM1202910.1 glycosyltransferase [Bacteroidales bacterium]